MPLIVATTSSAAAENAARRLRLEGFLARAACRGHTPLVIVNCIDSDRDIVLHRVKAADAQSWALHAQGA